MLNQSIVVGRIIKKPELIITDIGKKLSKLVLAIPRNYKNENGEYDTDFIDCVLYNTVAESTVEYCKKGDLIGVKGKLENETVEVTKDIIIQNTRLIAEKVTFLSSKKQ